MAKYLCLLISLALINFFNFALSARVLFIGPYNQHIKSHFALAQTMSEVLAKHPFIEYLDTKAWFSDARFDSVVLLSFGSVFKTEYMPKSLYSKFIGAFKQFPKTLFIVKINSDSGENDRPENVAFTKWMQQPLILANPKTKVFITPCGSNSVVDSLAVGTPLLCIPVTTDQPYNSYLLAEKGMAWTVSIEQIEKSETLHTNPLVIALGKMMGWKDGNRHFKAKIAKVKEEMSRGEKNFVDSMGHLAAQIDDGKILEATKKIGAK